MDLKDIRNKQLEYFGLIGAFKSQYKELMRQYKKEKNMCKIGPFLQIDDNMQMRLLTSLVKYSKTFQFKGFHKKNTTTKGGDLSVQILLQHRLYKI